MHGFGALILAPTYHTELKIYALKIFRRKYFLKCLELFMQSITSQVESLPTMRRQYPASAMSLRQGKPAWLSGVNQQYVASLEALSGL